MRGLHYQAAKYAQGKLCSVIVGKVLDVAVDIRSVHQHWKYFSVELNEETKINCGFHPDLHMDFPCFLMTLSSATNAHRFTINKVSGQFFQRS